MRRYLFFRVIWYLVNGFLLLSLLMVFRGLIWEYSTKCYLQGFADAIVPRSASPEHKVEVILAWMKNATNQPRVVPQVPLVERDPPNILEYQRFLEDCGNVTNAFINLTASAGLKTRRLLLLNENKEVKHVVAEVQLGNCWVVVDPFFHILFRDREGRPLTKEDLRDPEMLWKATQRLTGYNPHYTYERTAYIRVERIPYLGSSIRTILNRTLPGWEGKIAATLIFDRASLMQIFKAMILLCFSLLARLSLGWYGEKTRLMSRKSAKGVV